VTAGKKDPAEAGSSQTAAGFAGVAVKEKREIEGLLIERCRLGDGNAPSPKGVNGCCWLPFHFP
jgi:hypothetical protein